MKARGRYQGVRNRHYVKMQAAWWQVNKGYVALLIKCNEAIGIHAQPMPFQ